MLDPSYVKMQLAHFAAKGRKAMTVHMEGPGTAIHMPTEPGLDCKTMHRCTLRFLQMVGATEQDWLIETGSHHHSDRTQIVGFCEYVLAAHADRPEE